MDIEKSSQNFLGSVKINVQKTFINVVRRLEEIINKL